MPEKGMCAVNGILNFSGNYIPCCCNLFHSACFRENRFDGSPVFSDENKYLNGHAAELHLSLPAASKRSTMRSQSVLSPGLDSICICIPARFSPSVLNARTMSEGPIHPDCCKWPFRKRAQTIPSCSPGHEKSVKSHGSE